MSTKINIRANPPIDLTKHREIVNIGRKIMQGKRINECSTRRQHHISKTLRNYKETTLNIFKQSSEHSGMISPKQLKYLEHMTQNYQRLKKFEENFEENLKSETRELFEETYEYLSSFVERSHDLQGLIIQEINELERKCYSWNNNLNSIKDIIEKQYSGKHLELDLPKKFLEKYENLSTRLHFDFYEKEYS